MNIRHDCSSYLQALIRFKNFFYFEEKDAVVDEYEKVGLGMSLVMQ